MLSPRRPAPADPVAKLAATIRRLEKKEAEATALDAEVGGMLRRRVKDLEAEMAATVATSLRGVHAQLRLLGRRPVSAAPWLVPEIDKLATRIGREGLTATDVEWISLMRMGAAYQCGESHPHAVGLAVTLEGVRGLLEPAPHPRDLGMAADRSLLS